MSLVDDFARFLSNISIDMETRSTISIRYRTITKRLNVDFWNSESEDAHSLYVGSYGRNTAISDFSDMDMLFVLPDLVYEKYKQYTGNGQSALLQAVRSSLLKTYPNTKVSGDGQVVVIEFSDGISFEIVPCFEKTDKAFIYPDANDGGRWRITNPLPEIKEIASADNKKNGNLKFLCKMVRAWKNKMSVIMGGLLIDTLAYRFLTSISDYDNAGYSKYPSMVRDFFKFLAEQEEQNHYLAVGSNQYVYVKKNFIRVARYTYNICVEAMQTDCEVDVNKKWRQIFGRPFPVCRTTFAEAANGVMFDNTEEFIENIFHIDIKYYLEIDCKVSRNGFREMLLAAMLKRRIPLHAKKKLLFYIVKNETPEPFDVYWKILNRGEMARRKNMIRGQIVVDAGKFEKKETTDFKGDHLCECYVVKNGVVVARCSILVPIISNKEDVI